MARNTVTFSGNKVIPTIADMTKVASKDVFGMQDFIVVHQQNYLALKKEDFTNLYTDIAKIEIKNTGETGARFNYRLECGDSDDGWAVESPKSSIFHLLPRQKHVISLFCFLDTKTSQKESKIKTKHLIETTFTIPISAWKQSTLDEAIPTKMDSIIFNILIPENVPIHSKIKYELSLDIIDQKIVHPFFM
jgi:hypothetical protein